MTEFFHGPYEYSRIDHVANEIQRFRDHGLPGLNTILTSFGLPTEDNWDHLGSANGVSWGIEMGGNEEAKTVLSS